MGAALVLALVGFGLLAVGVLIGRYYVPDDRALKRTARHSRAYMRAINHLLGRDKEAAIAELRKVVEEDVNDIEPYFALGALFRSRGEWERAVRVHQAIELRPDTNKRTRLRALYELGLDFRSAGMPRRATRAMEQCLEEDNKHEGALRALCGLYEEQHYYAEAADVWGRLEKLRTGDKSTREPHLWAAAARQAIESGDVESAKRFLKRAERLDADAPHTIAAGAELAAARGNPRGASKQLRRALRSSPELAPYLVPALEEAERQQVYGEAGVTEDAQLDDDRRDDLQRLVVDRTARVLDDVIDEVGPHPLLRMARAQLRAAWDLEGALADLRLVLEQEPSLLAARIAASRLVLAFGDDETVRGELAALMAPDGPLARLTEGMWRCDNCGRFDTEFFWRCDPCRTWGSARFDSDRTQDASDGQARERRALPRPASRTTYALPPPPEAAAAGPQRPTLIGRAGSWISGAWSGMRGRAAKQLPPPDDDTKRLSE